MKTDQLRVEIWDCGCGAIIDVDSEGFYSIIQSGGCDVEKVLGKALLWSSPDTLQDLADEILESWVNGYDGDPNEHGLRVTVKRNGLPVAESAA